MAATFVRQYLSGNHNITQVEAGTPGYDRTAGGWRRQQYGERQYTNTAVKNKTQTVNGIQVMLIPLVRIFKMVLIYSSGRPAGMKR